MKRLTVLIEPELLKRFKARVAMQGLDMSSVVRHLIGNWLRENEAPQDKE